MRVLFLCLILAFTACSSMQSSSAEADAAPAPAAAENNQGYEQTTYYLDFADVLVPMELKYDDEESFVFETSATRAGLLKFSGRVDHVSLFDFFVINMGKDGWKRVSSFKSKKSTLIFEKPGKATHISILDEPVKTKVDILVVEQR